MEIPGDRRERDAPKPAFRQPGVQRQKQKRLVVHPRTRRHFQTRNRKYPKKNKHILQNVCRTCIVSMTEWQTSISEHIHIISFHSTGITMSQTPPRKLAILVFAAFSLFIAVLNLTHGLRSIPGYDFRLRYHEVECLRQGIDPYDIVIQKTPSTEFALFGTPEAKPGVKTLHVYTPWEYTYFLPLSFLSERAAGTVFLLISTAALALTGVYSYREGLKIRHDLFDSIFTASAALFLGYEAGEVLVMGNYGAINAFLIILLIVTVSAGHDISAGIVWAFLMTKPQIGVLFAIPLLMKRRFITAGVAVAICVICTIPPCLLCGKNPLEMILEVPRGCAFIAEENGTLLIPSTVFIRLHDKVPSAVLGGISMFIGSAICLILTWRLRKTSSWLAFFAPAVICALIWNYCKPHDRVILSAIQLLAALAAIRTDKKSVRVFSLILIALVAWPLLPDEGILTKLIRRISLGMAIFGCWILPKLHLFDAEKEPVK